MTSIDFNIDAWEAWPPHTSSRKSWPSWARSQKKFKEEPGPSLDLTGFPGMLRRRLSTSGKMAMHTVLAVDKGADRLKNVPAVFCSQHGEVSRSVKLLNAIAASEPLSPTEFSLSVHNAIAGVYSIGMERQAPVTAISGGIEPIVAAFIESLCLAKEFGQGEVLCIFYDQFLPKPYPSEMDECPMELALALLLSTSEPSCNSLQVRLSSKIEKTPKFASGQSVADLLRFLLDDSIYLKGKESILMLTRR